MSIRKMTGGIVNRVPGMRYAYYRVAGAWRVMPDVFILGQQKCGTTSLHDYLVQHPDVQVSKSKEPHYYTQPAKHTALGRQEYRYNFPGGWTQFRRTLRGRGRVRTCDATPALGLPSVASHIARDVPDAQIILVLRDPVDRAFSHYNHQRRKGREERPFSEAIRAKDDKVTALKARRMSADPAGIRYPESVQNMYCLRSMYGPQIEEVYRYFSPDHVFVRPSTELFESGREFMKDLATFLGLPAFEFDVSQASNVHPGNEKISREDRRFLGTLFAASNQQLFELTGIDFRA